MNTKPLDLLLEKLSRGDVEAAEQVFVTYERFLRMVVRRSLPEGLRAKFDSIDVVQSVWVHVLRGLRHASWQFTDRFGLQALLVRVARRRLVSRYRQHHTALEREEPGSTSLEGLPAPHQPGPSEIVQAEELWQQMLSLCPPAHRDILVLRRQGLPLREIALRTGIHEGSVRRILRRLSRRLAIERQPFTCSCG